MSYSESKAIKPAGLTLLLLAAGPLCAQRFETGLFIGQQQYDSYSYSVRGPSTVGVAPETNRVVAGRFGVTVADFGPARMVVTLGFQPEKSTPTKRLGTALFDDLKYRYYSIGAGVAMTSIVALSVNLELRSESLNHVYGTYYGSGSDGYSTTWNRAWLRFNLSYTFPSVGIKPFIGFETASALTIQSDPVYGRETTDILLKAMAPKSQSGIYAGVRF